MQNSKIAHNPEKSIPDSARRTPHAKIVDFHTHPTFEGQGGDRESVDGLVAYARSLGVEHMVVLGDVLLYGRLPAARQVQAINDKTMELIRWHPDYFTGFCFLNPLLGAQFVREETERCIVEHGFKGIKLEICNNARDDCMEPVMEQARKLGVPVLQHSADQTVIQQREYHTDPADTAWLGRQYPDVPIVMAHLTACGMRGVMEIAGVPNVWVDTSAYQPVAGLVEYAVEKLGAHRILYGSDLLIRDLSVQIGRVLGARIAEADKKAILYENAKWLLEEGGRAGYPQNPEEPLPVRLPPTASPQTDINVSYGLWPFQRFDAGSLQELADRLQAEGIERALVSHLGGVLHPDAHPFNRELIRAAASIASIVPVPVVNPAWPAWEKQLDSYREIAQISAIKIYPSFHTYRLVDDVMTPLTAYLREHDIRLLVQIRMEDERMQHPVLQIPPVPVDDIINLHRRFPDAPFVCLNAYLPEARRIGRETSGVGVDTSFCEWMYTLERLLEDLPPECIYFGSHTPFLYTRASVLKLSQSRVAEEDKKRIGVVDW